MIPNIQYYCTYILMFFLVCNYCDVDACLKLCVSTYRSLIKMRVIGSLLLLLTSLVDVSVPQCTIEDFTSNVVNMVNSTNISDNNQSFTINSTYYNCLSRSDISDHYSSMSVSILYIRSDDPNNIHEVRYNLQCNNSVWGIVRNQLTALRKNNTRYCEDCTDQTVNEYHCTIHYVGKNVTHICIILYMLHMHFTVLCNKYCN